MSITPMKSAYDPAPEFLREPAPDDETLSYPGETGEQTSRWRVGKVEAAKAGGVNMRFVLIAGIVLAGMLIFLAGMFTGAALVAPEPVESRTGMSSTGPAAGKPGMATSETLMAPKSGAPAQPSAKVPAPNATPAVPKPVITPDPGPAAPAAAQSETPAAETPPAAAVPAEPVTAPPPVAEAAPAAPPAPPLAKLTPPKPPAPPAPAAPDAAAPEGGPAAPPLEQLARELEGQSNVAPKALVKPVPAPAPAGAFTIQMGAFSGKTNADRLAARFKKQEIDAFVVRGTDSKGRTLHYVRSGSFESREKARVEADRIKQVAGTPAIVVTPDKSDVRL